MHAHMRPICQVHHRVAINAMYVVPDVIPYLANDGHPHGDVVNTKDVHERVDGAIERLVVRHTLGQMPQSQK
jgi:hypothetical protein